MRRQLGCWKTSEGTFAFEVRERIPVCMPKPGRWAIRFNSDWSGYGDDFDNINLDSQLDAVSPEEPLLYSISPYSLQILVYLGDEK